MGEALNEAKSILPKGKFGPWTEAQFGFKAQWRGRLMKLADTWLTVLEALEWAKGSGRVLGRTEYGVNGALALVAEHARASDPEAAAKAAERRAKLKAGAGLRLAAKDALAAAQGEADTLRKQLAEALERVASLEARLKGQSLHSGVKTVEAPPGYTWAQSASGIPPQRRLRPARFTAFTSGVLRKPSALPPRNALERWRRKWG